MRRAPLLSECVRQVEFLYLSDANDCSVFSATDCFRVIKSACFHFGRRTSIDSKVPMIQSHTGPGASSPTCRPQCAKSRRTWTTLNPNRRRPVKLSAMPLRLAPPVRAKLGFLVVEIRQIEPSTIDRVNHTGENHEAEWTTGPDRRRRRRGRRLQHTDVPRRLVPVASPGTGRVCFWQSLARKVIQRNDYNHLRPQCTGNGALRAGTITAIVSERISSKRLLHVSCVKS